jgi:hypothetical protein
VQWRRVCGAVAFVLWVAALLFGARTLLNYEGTPGVPGRPPTQWPSQSYVMRPIGTYTLVMFAHPNCPCTRASLAELETIMTQLQGKLSAFVLFSIPGGSSAEVQASDLWRRSATIPGVQALYDQKALETERFGARVSGQTMLYDPEGRLAFSGGITDTRGHQGSNFGADAVIRTVTNGGSASFRAPVFGCALHDPTAETLREASSWKKR